MLRSGFIILIIAVLAGTGIYQVRLAADLRSEAKSLRKQQVQLAERLRQMERERQEATNRLAAANAEVAQLKAVQNASEVLKLRGQVGMLQRQIALIKEQANSASASIPALMKDPAMRDYMRQSQMNFIKWNFGSLFKQLKLTPDQIEQATQLMGDRFLKVCEQLYSVPQGTFSAAQLAQAAADREAEFNKDLSPIWGDDGNARFKQFFEEIPAHATVDLLNAQLGANPLSGDQSDRLYKILKAEPFDLTRGMADIWDPAFWGTQDHIDDHLGKISESNQRVLDQASSFLTPDQLSLLNAVLSNGINSRIKQAAALIPKH